jgi:pectinesterase
VFYAEYKCSGPGANTAKRVPWSKVLTDAQAAPFLTTGFINGEQWLSQT